MIISIPNKKSWGNHLLKKKRRREQSSPQMRRVSLPLQSLREENTNNFYHLTGGLSYSKSKDKQS